MMTRLADGSPRSLAKIAGFLYLVIIVGGLFAPFAIAPSGMVMGDAALPTAAKILASKRLFVLGGAAQLLVYACDIGVALIFYELLKPVGRSVALLATFFRLTFVAIAGANMLNHFAPLIFLSGADYLHSFAPDQLQSLALSFLRLRTFGFDIALVFFGLHWLLAGYLIFKSTFLPRILGVALAIGGNGLFGQHWGNRYFTRHRTPSLSLHYAACGLGGDIADSVAHHCRRECPEMEPTKQRQQDRGTSPK
jgi:hypothetical protein